MNKGGLRSHGFALASLATVLFAACAQQPAVSPQTATFTAQDYGFSGPSKLNAGTINFRLQNRGQHAHMLGVVALSGGKTFTDLFQDVQKSASGDFPTYATWVGGADAVDPGGTSIATVHLASGNYAVVCTMPDGDTGKTHLNRVMIQGLTVTGPEQSAPPPKASVVLNGQEFSYTTDGTIAAGTQTIQVRNNGQQQHEAQLSRLPDTVNVDQYIALNDATNAASGSSFGGLASIQPGANGFFTANFTPGRYAFICFNTDPATGKSDFQLGMIHELTVP